MELKTKYTHEWKEGDPIPKVGSIVYSYGGFYKVTRVNRPVITTQEVNTYWGQQKGWKAGQLREPLLILIRVANANGKLVRGRASVGRSILYCRPAIDYLSSFVSDIQQFIDILQKIEDPYAVL